MITLIIGPMFSGKSSRMKNLLVRARIAGKKTILIRPITDTRGFLIHDNVETNPIQEIFTQEIIAQDYTKYDVIGIDEGQFFNGEFVSNVNKLADLGKHIIIAALNGTSEQQEFENVQGLIPFAEEIIKLNAICINCGSEYGTYSFYKAGNKTDKVKVGEQEYSALCRECYNKMRC